MEIITLKNNAIMENQILKQGDFTLKHFAYCNVYSLLYKGSIIWGGDINELLDTEFRDYIFERVSEPKKVTKFLNELYNWGFSQPGTLEKILDEEYK